MSNANEKPSTLITPGTYKAKPMRWGWIETNGKLSFMVELRISDGRTVPWFGSAKVEDKGNGSAWDVASRAISAMGGNPDDPEKIELSKDRVVNVEIEIDKDPEGYDRNKVRSIFASALDTKAAPPASIQHFATQVREARGS